MCNQKLARCRGVQRKVGGGVGHIGIGTLGRDHCLQGIDVAVETDLQAGGCLEFFGNVQHLRIGCITDAFKLKLIKLCGLCIELISQ